MSDLLNKRQIGLRFRETVNAMLDNLSNEGIRVEIEFSRMVPNQYVTLSMVGRGWRASPVGSHGKPFLITVTKVLQVQVSPTGSAKVFLNFTP